MTADELNCTVGDLMHAFRDALVALTPTADRLQLSWRDDQQHVHWEGLAMALYTSYVRGTIDADSSRRGDEFRLPHYDIDETGYGERSRISVLGQREPNAFVRLLSSDKPFDTVQFAVLDPGTLEPLGRATTQFANAKFVFVRRSADGLEALTDKIVAID